MGQGQTEGTGVSSGLSSLSKVHDLRKVLMLDCSSRMELNHNCCSLLQKDDPIDLTGDHLREEKFADEHGNVVSKVGVTVLDL